ncbi:MAG: SEC-C metal-binding domain-containing protein, partial [Planctomycetales bacterium]
KFGLELKTDEFRNLETNEFEDRIFAEAEKTYQQREIEFPVMAGLVHFTTRDASGNKRYDREQLVAWARERFSVDLDLDDLRSKQRDQIKDLLIEQSRTSYIESERVEADLDKLLESVFNPTASNGQAMSDAGVEELVGWYQNNLETEIDADSLARLERDQIERKFSSAVQDRFCPEIRRMERTLALEILDAAWKDHLLAMDHLRSSVGLRGYAQVDPKVEYKREGMRIFEAMWNSIDERVTDLVFRIEQLDDDFVSSNWVETSATHDEARSGAELVREQGSSEGGEIQPEERIEPIRNRSERVGRNAPCPCGSGKKYKNCCLRRQSS